MNGKGTLTFSFGTIRNNTALKPTFGGADFDVSFGTIRNNTALKLEYVLQNLPTSFGTIRNNTALKQTCWPKFDYERFWNHSKQHSSKTRFAS